MRSTSTVNTASRTPALPAGAFVRCRSSSANSATAAGWPAVRTRNRGVERFEHGQVERVGPRKVLVRVHRLRLAASAASLAMNCGELLNPVWSSHAIVPG